MQIAVAKFYSQIFMFLSDVMSWMTRKRRDRLLDSFKEDFTKRFEDQVEDIRNSSKKMLNLVILGASAEQRVTRLTVEWLGQEVHGLRTGLEGQSRDRAEEMRERERMNKEFVDFKAAIRDEWPNLKQLSADLQLLLRGQAMATSKTTANQTVRPDTHWRWKRTNNGTRATPSTIPSTFHSNPTP